MPLTRYILFNKKINAVRASRSYSIFYIADMVFFVICYISKIIVVIPLTHHKNGGFTELKAVGVWRSIILLFTAFSADVLKG